MAKGGTTKSILIFATVIVAVFFGLNLYTYARGRGETALAIQAGEKQVTIPVQGMSCFSCELSVQKGLQNVKGVTSSKAIAAKGMVTVSYDPSLVSIKDLVAAINKTGYKAKAPK